MPTVLITGASRGLGRAVALALAHRGWSIVADARGSEPLATAARDLLEAGAVSVESVTGDVTDPEHRGALARVVHRGRGVDLLVNNASALGPSPMPALADYQLSAWQQVYATNVLAPLALTQLLLPTLRASAGTVLNVSSDAAVGAYAGWGGYGSSKAALDQWTAILGVEEPDLHVYSFDPGDMRTQMHADAFPGEDISDRPDPGTVVPALLRLFDETPPNGRYLASELLAEEQAVAS